MSFWGSITGSDAIKDAAKENRRATQAAIAAQREAGDQAVGYYDPYRKTGLDAWNKLATYAGLNGVDAQKDAYDDYVESPGVEFLREQGIRGIDRSAAAAGGLKSGRTLADVSKFNQGLAEQDFGNFINRITDLKNTGYGATGASADARLGVGGNISNLIQRGGENQAQLAYERGMIVPNLIGNTIGAGVNLLGRWADGGFRSPFGSSSSGSSYRSRNAFAPAAYGPNYP